MNQAGKQYLKELRLAFPVFQKSEKRFYSDIKNSIEEFQNENRHTTSEDLEDKYGMPKDVVVDYFNNMGAGEYMKLMRKRLYEKISVVLLLLFIMVSFLYEYYSIEEIRDEARNTTIVSEKTEIIDVDFPEMK